MTSRLIFVLVALGLACPLGFSNAQVLSSRLAPRDRVRLTVLSTDIHREIATVIAVGEDSLVLERRWAGQPLRAVVPLDSIAALEISRGRTRNAATGVALGAGVGAGVGLLAGVAQVDACKRSGGFLCGLGYVSAVGFAAFGAGAGAALGLMLGGTTDRERWERVPLRAPGRLGALVTALPAGGLGLGGSISF